MCEMNFRSPEMKRETAEKYQKSKVKTQDGADGRLLATLEIPQMQQMRENNKQKDDSSINLLSVPFPVF